MLQSPYLASANAEGPRLHRREARELEVHGMRCECVHKSVYMLHEKGGNMVHICMYVCICVGFRCIYL